MAFTDQSERRISDAVRYVEHRFYPHKSTASRREVRDAESGVVRVRNTLGVTLEKGDIVALGEPVRDVATRGFLMEPYYFTALYDEETHKGKFAVMLHACPSGESRKARTSGTVQCLVAVADEETPTTKAGPSTGDILGLTAGKKGGTVKWIQPGTGYKRALVDLGAGSESGNILHGRLNTDLTSAMSSVMVLPTLWTGDYPGNDDGEVECQNPTDLLSYDEDPRYLFFGNYDGFCVANQFDGEWWLSLVQTPVQIPIAPEE